MKGKIHSFQSMGTVDGPGVRYVVFMHGCNLKCGYCHNIDVVKGEYTEYSSKDILNKVIRFQEYFANDGGITISGGEPLLQAEFVYDLFKLCHENGINTCLDTSGSVLNDSVLKVLEYTDLVLLDVKMSNDEDYQKHIGMSLDNVIDFLKVLDNKNIDCWIRQVIVEGINDNDNNIGFLNKLSSEYECIKKVELLPFKKICKTKYEQMNIPFEFDCYPQTSKDTINKLNNLLIK